MQLCNGLFSKLQTSSTHLAARDLTEGAQLLAVVRGLAGGVVQHVVGGVVVRIGSEWG